MTVVYEVTVVVEGDPAADFEEFMRRRHIPEVLATGYFTGASFLRSSSGTRYCTRYTAESREALDNYLESAAAALRADFLEHFPAGVQVSREVWEEIEKFDAKAGAENAAPGDQGLMQEL